MFSRIMGIRCLFELFMVVAWLQDTSVELVFKMETERRPCPLVTGADCVAMFLSMASLCVSYLNFTIYNRIIHSSYFCLFSTTSICNIPFLLKFL